jgi:hypothetical protein
MTDLTLETIAHLRALDAARTQGAWTVDRESPDLPVLAPDTPGFTWDGVFVCTTALDSASEPNAADAEFIAGAANHMGALLDAAEEWDRCFGAHERTKQSLRRSEAEVSRLRAELAEARAVIERVTAALHQGGQTPNIRARAAMAALAPATQREEGER